MNDTKTVAVALIKNDEGKYLLVRLADYYPSFREHKESWCPVAGHIKNGETKKDALIREVHEELGVNAEPISEITKWEQDIPGEKAVWWNVKIEGEIKSSDEIAEYGYFSEEEIKKLKLWPATQKFFEKFIWNK